MMSAIFWEDVPQFSAIVTEAPNEKILAKYLNYHFLLA